MKGNPYAMAVEQEPRHHVVIPNETCPRFRSRASAHNRTLCHHHAQEYPMCVAGGAQNIRARPATAIRRGCSAIIRRLRVFAPGWCREPKMSCMHRFLVLSSEISPGLGSYYSPVKVLYCALVKGTTESLP